MSEAVYQRAALSTQRSTPVVRTQADVDRELNHFKLAIQTASFELVAELWADVEEVYGIEGKSWLGRNDRFYLLTRLLHRVDAVHPWLYARCREVEANPDGYLDLWAREHYKSTIITFAGIIQEIARDSEITIGIFSHSKTVAKKFLQQIKLELETNRDLVAIYPESFWVDPKRQAPRWSEDKGLICRRRGNPKEATVEAWGLVDGQPTGAHFLLRVYDDVVTPESVNTPEQITKTTAAWELSDNLGARGPDGMLRAWHAGTRYSFADTYQAIIDRNALKLRVYPATDNGLPDGKPVFLSEAAWADKKIKQTSATLACQMLMNPAAGKQAMFRKDWLQFLDVRPATLNVYIMVDPAHSKKKDSDNTAIAVIGIDATNDKFLLDGMRHKMGLKERWEAVRDLRRIWMRQPGVQMVKVGYERYGMQADLEYFEEQMLKDKDSFEIIELNWTSDGTRAKEDRVQRLQPDFASKRFFLAMACVRKVPVIGVDGQPVSNDPRIQAEVTLLKRVIGRGFDVEAFMGSEPGKYFQLRANRELEEAQEALVQVDAADIAAIRALQMKAQVAQRVLTWFGDAVTEGENAERELTSLESHPD